MVCKVLEYFLLLNKWVAIKEILTDEWSMNVYSDSDTFSVDLVGVCMNRNEHLMEI